jgi:predicted ArsR family transcriptional regulator
MSLFFKDLASALGVAALAILAALMALSAFGVVVWAYQPSPAGLPDLLWWLKIFSGAR